MITQYCNADAAAQVCGGGCVDARDAVRVSRRRDNLDSELKG